MPATASTATAVDTRMARSMPLVRGAGGSSSADGTEPAADCFGKLILLGGSANRTQIGLGEIGAGHDSSSVTGWEESGRSQPARTALNLSQPS